MKPLSESDPRSARLHTGQVVEEVYDAEYQQQIAKLEETRLQVENLFKRPRGEEIDINSIDTEIAIAMEEFKSAINKFQPEQEKSLIGGINRIAAVITKAETILGEKNG